MKPADAEGRTGGPAGAAVGRVGRPLRNRLVVVLAGAALLAGLGALGFGLTRNPFRLPSPLVGRPAPAFTLAVMAPPAPTARALWAPPAGLPDSVRMADLAGSVVVLNFWASWCLACREEHAPLSTVAEAYRERGVRFFGVLYQDRPENARRWIRQMGGQAYPTLLDPGSSTAIAYGVYGVPETYFIGRRGRIAGKHIGPVTAEALRGRIDSLLRAPPAPLERGEPAERPGRERRP